MKNETEKIIELFGQYALKRLANHKRKLALSYHRASVGPAHLNKLSHKTYSEIFQGELSNKIRELTSIQNEFIKPELKLISEEMLKQLS